MKPLLILSFAIAAVFAATFSQAQQKGVTIGKKSGWIESASYDPQGHPEEGEGASYYYLLLDEQQNAVIQQDYFHYAYAILTSEGIQEMSDLSFEFDPGYQNLIFHELKVIRGGATIDHLTKTNINVIQREESMDRSLYDGAKTAVINMKDIRVGDVIEYSFTRVGFNPVYKNHINWTAYFNSYQSADKYFKKLIIPSSTKVTLKTLGKDVPAPETTEVSNTVHYTWKIDKPKAIQYETNTPSWHNTNNIAMISDFQTWGDVGEWARELFNVNAADKEKIKNEVAPTFKSTYEHDYILEVIHFVQDEVRYLGFETGINSHKPHPPAQVYEQRFGDCKDKSLLLITLLNARGIKAYPMLVNTSLKEKIDARLPSGSIFDHCVVQIIFNNKKNIH